MKSILLILLALLIISPVFVYAQTNTNCGPQGSGYKLCVPLPGQKDVVADFGDYIRLIYQFALAIAGVVVFGLIVYGGIVKTLSAGNVAGQEEANDIIKHAIFGLILLFLATLILYIINPNLLVIKFGRSGESVKSINFKNVPNIKGSQQTISQPTTPTIDDVAREGVLIKNKDLR